MLQWHFLMAEVLRVSEQNPTKYMMRVESSGLRLCTRLFGQTMRCLAYYHSISVSQMYVDGMAVNQVKTHLNILLYPHLLCIYLFLKHKVLKECNGSIVLYLKSLTFSSEFQNLLGFLKVI